ncbi:hypothetical protein [Mammaliicoccus sp. Dog046]|uniref:hypothetical protein n=1 Tax=Mammaliicoccus sp. Dog046 TaxID=3034233 RepID=UPI002B25868E|nr:hypothetical protein [Mammaliicoccus sp. Dog046]WQK85564.1 hypothetical protein P3U32_00620 [Mammaliicoccus sp. Dog046]
MSKINELSLEIIQKQEKIGELKEEKHSLSNLIDEYESFSNENKHLFNRLGERYIKSELFHSIEQSHNELNFHKRKVISSLQNQQDSLNKEIINIEQDIHNLEKQKSVEIKFEEESRKS